MSMLPTTTSRRSLTVLGAVVALAGSGLIAANLAGAASGLSALDYAQCDNGPPGSAATTHCPSAAWINGILNSNNSHYQEDDVTPQRLTVTYPDKGAGDHVHTITLRYLDRKAGVHAYDYLAAANATMTSAIDDRCNGLPTSYCPDGTQSGGAPSQASVAPAYAADTTTVFPDPNKTTGLAKDHMANLTADQLKLSVFGATFTSGAQAVVSNAANPGSNPPAVSTPTHDNACTGCGDDYARVVLSFTTNGDGPHNVQLLFGGHLAAGFNADGWGENLGAGGISGGPYHIKWDAADGVSVGNRDNQIQSSAIAQIIPEGSTLTTTPSKTSETVGSSNLNAVTDTADLTPDSGHAPTGTMTFTLYGPLTSPDFNDCTDPVGGVGGNVKSGPDTGHSLSPKSGSPGTYSATSASVNMSGYAPGVYQWVADYVAGSDQFNTDVNGDCGDSGERVTIGQASATGSSTQHVTDTVTVTAGFGTPTGTVTFEAFTDSGCTLANRVLNDTNNALNGSNQATSDAIDANTSTGTVTYYWKVTYNGDANNASGVIEACGVQTAAIQNHS